MIDKSEKVTVIAEAGVNHNGSLDLAVELIDSANDCGADYVKFQTFITEELVTDTAKIAEYQKDKLKKTNTQLELLKSLELTRSDHIKLKNYCNTKNISFLSSAFDLRSLEFLINEIDVDLLKIPSGEITNLPYLRIIGSSSKPIVMSTGMSSNDEIDEALNALILSGSSRENITLLHCNTAYPTPMQDVNLKAMLSLQDTFKTDVGFSDHTLGIEAPIAAVAMGAKVIEKHFTLDNSFKGPDHKASLEPLEFKTMVNAIRNISLALGDAKKRITASELKNIATARKSIVARRDINKDEVLDNSNITTKRPGNGTSPMLWDSFIGKKLKQNIKKDQLISENDLLI